MEEMRNTNDKTVEIKCRDCGTVFKVGEDEQIWYAARDWNLPERCPSCRKLRRKQRKENEQNKGR